MAQTKQKKSTPRQNTDAKIRYLVQRSSESDVIIEIPATWRLTFGYVNPAHSEGGYRGGQGHCLRIYEGEKLRAVMGNVAGFRDLSIPLARKFEKESGEAKWSRDSDGNFEGNEQRQLETGFSIEEVDNIDF